MHQLNEHGLGYRFIDDRRDLNRSQCWPGLTSARTGQRSGAPMPNQYPDAALEHANGLLDSEVKELRT